MTKEEYIRNKSYGLIYLYYEEGFQLKNIPTIFMDEEAGKSVVISAIGSNINYKNYDEHSSYIDIKKPIIGNSGRLFGTVDSMKIFFWITAATKSQVKNLLRENSEYIKQIRSAYKIYNEQKCKSVIALLDLTKVKNYEPGDVAYINCAKLKIGGAELISEYLLSNFIIEWENEFIHSRLEPVGDIYLKSIHGDKYEDLFYISSLEPDNYECGFSSPLFTFDKELSLNHLTSGKVVWCEDDYESWKTEDGSYCYYNLDLTKVDKINSLLQIPSRVLAILDKNQINHLSRTAASIIIDNLIYVYSSILLQDVPTDLLSISNNERFNTWGSDMYDILGGRGSDTVYLGDGLSIDSNGNIVDD